MHHCKSRAFTLIELLVVITIIAVLAGIALPVFGSVQLSGRKTQSLSNMRQLGALLLSYCTDNDELLPTQGPDKNSTPTWAAAANNSAAENAAWYNALPWMITGSTKPGTGGQGLGDYATKTAAFYAKGSLFYVPAAKYPSNKLAAPLFAVSYNSKLFGTFGSEVISVVRLNAFQSPAKTCIFQESGLLGETKINTSQSAYNGQGATFASRSVARYNGQTLMVFADGHCGELSGNQVVAPGGKAYYPQLTAPGEVIWTIDPAANPNS